MSRRSRRLSPIAVGLLASAAVVAIIWIASSRWALIWQGDRFQTSLAGGVWSYAYSPKFRIGLGTNGLHFSGYRGWRWLPSLSLPGPTGVYSAALPLWIPTIALGAWPAFRLARRRPGPDACPACGYSRAGLTANAPCPECGEAPDGETTDKD